MRTLVDTSFSDFGAKRYQGDMPYVEQAQPSAGPSTGTPSGSDAISLDQIRRRHVTQVLEHCNGNRTNAAKILHLDRKTLYRKLVRWGLASK